MYRAFSKGYKPQILLPAQMLQTNLFQTFAIDNNIRHHPHATPNQSRFHYSNKDIKLFKFISRAQVEVPLQPRPQWDIQKATNNNTKGAIDKGTARGYAEFKVKNVI